MCMKHQIQLNQKVKVKHKVLLEFVFKCLNKIVTKGLPCSNFIVIEVFMIFQLPWEYKVLTSNVLFL